jgi:D-threo-aldose 1-dehydrogenase
MDRRQLGRSPLALTELGFGGASIGNLNRAISDEQARAVVDAAWDGGVRYFDTAPHYGLGLSERRLGDALRHRPRADFVLSTKVGRTLVPNRTPTGSDLPVEGFDVPDDETRVFDFSAGAIRRNLESSLDRLGMDRIDIALVHDPDDYLEPAIEQAVPALLALRDEGVVGAVGVGMNQWRAPLEILARCDLDVVMLAGRWTLIDRSGRALLDACLDRGVTVLAAAPYNSGLLAQPEPPAQAHFDYRPVPPALLAQARALAAVARAHGFTLPDAALQFPLRHPAVASVVVGLRDAEQVHASLERLSRPISAAAWAELDAQLAS